MKKNTAVIRPPAVRDHRDLALEMSADSEASLIAFAWSILHDLQIYGWIVHLLIEALQAETRRSLHLAAECDELRDANKRLREDWLLRAEADDEGV